MDEKNLYKSFVETRVNTLEKEIRKIEEEMEYEIKRVKQKYYKKAKEKVSLEERLFKDLYKVLLHDISKMHGLPEARIKLYHPVKIAYNHYVPMISDCVKKYLDRSDYAEVLGGDVWAVPFLAIDPEGNEWIEIDYFYRIPSFHKKAHELEESLKLYNVHPSDFIYIGTCGMKRIEEFVDEIILDNFLSKLSPEEKHFHEPNILELIEFAIEILYSENDEIHHNRIFSDLAGIVYFDPENFPFIESLIKISKSKEPSDRYVSIIERICSRRYSHKWYALGNLKY